MWEARPFVFSGGVMAGKVGKVMHEFKEGEPHSGSSSGPKVTSRKQAIAIGLSEARKAGEKVPRRKVNKRRSPAQARQMSGGRY